MFSQAGEASCLSIHVPDGIDVTLSANETEDQVQVKFECTGGAALKALLDVLAHQHSAGKPVGWRMYDNAIRIRQSDANLLVEMMRCQLLPTDDPSRHINVRFRSSAARRQAIAGIRAYLQHGNPTGINTATSKPVMTHTLRVAVVTRKPSRFEIKEARIFANLTQTQAGNLLEHASVDIPAPTAYWPRLESGKAEMSLAEWNFFLVLTGQVERFIRMTD